MNRKIRFGLVRMALVCALLLACAVTAVAEGCTHENAERHDKVPASCTEAGEKAYWYCDDCKSYFTDSDGSLGSKTNKDDLSIPPKGHDLTKHAAVSESCTEGGNSEYWSCGREGCGKYFSDSEGKNEIAKDSWIIGAKGHTLTKTDAKASTCKEAGNNAYWTCSVCKKVFADEGGTTETTVEAQTLALAAHTL
ncbi:MAG: hypothetical protein IKN05_11160, partial [Clostridia bacterium]|nr:hypothetical protein [Clostridia bacterium]